MFTLTANATSTLADLLEQNKQNDEDVFRLNRNGDQFGLSLDQQRDGDEVYHKDEKPVLVLGADVTEHLSEVAMDIADTPQGQQLTLVPAEEAAGGQ